MCNYIISIILIISLKMLRSLLSIVNHLKIFCKAKTNEHDTMSTNLFLMLNFMFGFPIQINMFIPLVLFLWRTLNNTT